jgi:chromosome segregation ATPase
MTVWIPLIVALLSLSGTVIVGILQIGKTNAEARKLKNDASSVITEDSLKLYNVWKTEALELRDNIRQLMAERQALQDSTAQLSRNIEALSTENASLKDQVVDLKSMLQSCTESCQKVSRELADLKNKKKRMAENGTS